MPTVVFAPVLQRHVECRPVDVAGGSVREALDAALTANDARGYILDDQAALRRHMLIFIDGARAFATASACRTPSRPAARFTSCNHYREGDMAPRVLVATRKLQAGSMYW